MTPGTGSGVESVDAAGATAVALVIEPPASQREVEPTAVPSPRRSLSDGLGGRNNSLGLIRVVLASAVIFSHAFPLGGWGEDPFGNLDRGQQNLGGMAVLGFFAISGYLITKSGMNSDIVQFLWHRFLRIFPAFWTVLLVGAIIVGPVIWTLSGHPLSAYLSFGPGSPVAYFTANWNLTIHQYGILDTFVNTPYGQAGNGSVLNGSIWTLSYEWICYLIVGLLVLSGALTKAKILVPILTAFFFAMQVLRLAVPSGPGTLVPYLADPFRIDLPLIFLFGACLAIYSKKVPLDDRLALACAIVVLLTMHYGGLNVVGYPALAYFVMWLAARLPAPFRKIGSKNDYSYGIYVYGFLVEQILAFFAVYKLGYLPYSLLALAITLGCAWLSWHLIEKRALALKDWGPGRGIRYWWGVLRKERV